MTSQVEFITQFVVFDGS